jgi:hypothetical protein
MTFFLIGLCHFYRAILQRMRDRWRTYIQQPPSEPEPPQQEETPIVDARGVHLLDGHNPWRPLVLALTLGLSVVAHSATAEVREDGFWLLRDCTAAERAIARGERTIARGAPGRTCLGIAWAMMTQSIYEGGAALPGYDPETDRVSDMPICIPDKESAASIVSVLARQLNARKSYLSQGARKLLALVMEENYSCRQPSSLP